MLNPSASDPRPESPMAEPHAPRAKAAARVELDPTWRAGRKLEEARKQLGLSLQEVSDRIRVRREFLEALESMNLKLLPGRAYAIAFLRSYAQLLGLDVVALVDQFQTETALAREDAKAQIRNPSSKPHPERPWLAAAALLAIAAGFVGWRALTGGESSGPATPVAEAPAVVPRADPTASAGETAVAEARVVEIRALEQSWLEARGPDGTVFLSRTLEPGDVYRPDSSPGWTLHARNGGAFEVFVNGSSAGLLGAAGMPVLGRQIDEIHPQAQAALGAPGG